MRIKNALSLVLGVVALVGWGAVASAQSWNPTPGGPIFTDVRYYSAGQTVALETYSLAPATADTTLRLFRLDSSGAILNEVAWDADSGAGYASKLTWAVPAGQSGNYRIVVHSFVTAVAGTFSMFEKKNGVVSWFWNNKDFGGSVAYVAGVHAGNLLQTGFQPGDDVALNHQLLVLNTNLSGVTFTAPNGASNTALIVAPATTSYWVVAGALDNADRPMWLFHNDAPWLDSDGDGLGNNLEQTVGTCVSTTDTVGSQFKPCTAGRAADSDLDGIADYAELLGVDEVTEDLPLRRWGAHPLHKDVFAEVDWDNGLGAGYLLTGQWNDLGADPFATRLHDGYKDGTAEELDNPDGVDGINLHFDVAGSPWLDKDTNLALFFDGGGSSQAVDVCTSFSSRRLDSMNVARRPYFHYVCVDDEDGGVGNRPGLSVRVTNQTNGAVVIHELGHNMGLSHGGFEAFNGKPHYVSVMNYGFPGDRASALNTGANFFSRNTNSAQILNPDQMCENATVGSNSAALVGLSTAWYLGTDANRVDWDRDGNAAANCLTPATAPVNWITRRNATGWTGTAAFATNRVDLGAATSTSYSGTPALVAATATGTDIRSYVFYPVINSSGLDYVRYRSALFPDGKCDGPVTSFTDHCVDFFGEQSTGKRGQAVSAALFEHGGQPALFLAIREVTGALKVYRSSTFGITPSFTLDQTVVTGSTVAATSEPALAVANGQLYLVYLQADGLNLPLLKWVRRLANGTWSLPVAVGSNLRSTTAPTLALNPHDQALYLLRTRTFAGVNNAVQFIVLNGATNTWAPSATYNLDTAFSPDGRLHTATRPGLAWRSHKLDTPTGAGGWLITTTTLVDDFRTEMSYFDGTTDYGSPDNDPNPDLITGRLGVDAVVGSVGGAVALSYDSRLRHVQGAFIRDTGALRYLPYADGIYPYGLKDHDDYTYLAVGPCRSLLGASCAIPPATLPPAYPLSSTDDGCDWGAP